MATSTTNYNFIKPESTDTSEIITDLNTNYDSIDTELYTKADKDSDAVENNLAKFDSSGNPVDSGIAISDVSKNLYIVENPQTGTTYTLVLTDGHKLVSCANNDPITLTIPLNSNVAFPIGTQILIVQKGTGQITIGGDSNGTSVTVLSAGSVDTTVEQYSMAGLIKVDTDDWILFGDLE